MDGQGGRIHQFETEDHGICQCSILSSNYRLKFRDLFLRGRREIDARREVVERVLAMGSRQVLVDGLEVFQGSNLTVEDVSSGLKAIFCLTVDCERAPDFFSLYCRECFSSNEELDDGDPNMPLEMDLEEDDDEIVIEDVPTPLNQQAATGKATKRKTAVCAANARPSASSSREKKKEKDYVNFVRPPPFESSDESGASNRVETTANNAVDNSAEGIKGEAANTGADFTNRPQQMEVDHELHIPLADGVVIGGGSMEEPSFIPQTADLSPIAYPALPRPIFLTPATGHEEIGLMKTHHKSSGIRSQTLERPATEDISSAAEPEEDSESVMQDAQSMDISEEESVGGEDDDNDEVEPSQTELKKEFLHELYEYTDDI